ncbi:low molecular weight phosphotyrosine protein phosphatase [Vibrio sp. CAIM 722]|uniref:protein-tyrosine-phosphatase n=1 Tax=Vibrio eleionomae TaxID=2653505 RepID=A0A7X4LQ19_9VIBR|nr:low molecular weight phosphotyrosine protein phosphatase [Vibrio eleionomae]MZI95942.1 low molecular weight phosphotyrosine protein phosphatase [Vibrio eleionomae]
MFESILVVCVGNICRSPFGERYLQQLLPNKHVSSAGLGVKTSRLESKPADATAVKVADSYHVDLSKHEARQVTPEICKEVDLILVMEKKHISKLCEIAPEARGKAMLFSHWIGGKDIPDPYKKSEEFFNLSFSMIERSSQEWAKKI